MMSTQEGTEGASFYIQMRGDRVLLSKAQRLLDGIIKPLDELKWLLCDGAGSLSVSDEAFVDGAVIRRPAKEWTKWRAFHARSDWNRIQSRCSRLKWKATLTFGTEREIGEVPPDISEVVDPFGAPLHSGSLFLSLVLVLSAILVSASQFGHLMLSWLIVAAVLLFAILRLMSHISSTVCAGRRFASQVWIGDTLNLLAVLACGLGVLPAPFVRDNQALVAVCFGLFLIVVSYISAHRHVIRSQLWVQLMLASQGRISHRLSNTECLACGYSLENIETCRCPECGKLNYHLTDRFDAHKPALDKGWIPNTSGGNPATCGNGCTPGGKTLSNTL